MSKSELSVLITGAAAGIGEACARRLAANGARVAVADLSERRESVASEIGGIALALDVANDASFERCIEEVVARFGKLDVLINNAGLALPAKAVQDTTVDEFDRLIAVNLRGTYNGCRFAYPHLCRTRGNVLNISSMAGVTGQERHAVYAATPGAINALTKSCAVDWGKSGVRCNALCPAGVWTDALRAWAEVQPNRGEIEDYLNRIHALNYCPGPSEIADVAAFLVSDDARFITGAIMPVSGGSECGYRL
jgi:meso-butanediol dehydrogenase / (S,S)-butanediol dehydrogenase / diacetyl reductase